MRWHVSAPCELWQRLDRAPRHALLEPRLPGSLHNIPAAQFCTVPLNPTIGLALFAPLLISSHTPTNFCARFRSQTLLSPTNAFLCTEIPQLQPAAISIKMASSEFSRTSFPMWCPPSREHWLTAHEQSKQTLRKLPVRDASSLLVLAQGTNTLTPTSVNRAVY